MPVTQEIHEGDIGTKMLVTIKEVLSSGIAVVDVSAAVGAGTKVLIFKKHDGTRVETEASFETDGTDGQIYYISQDANFFNSVGPEWYVQGKVILGAATHKSSIGKFEVFENL